MRTAVLFAVTLVHSAKRLPSRDVGSSPPLGRCAWTGERVPSKAEFQFASPINFYRKERPMLPYTAVDLIRSMGATIASPERDAPRSALRARIAGLVVRYRSTAR
jgi:hypothetical protein